MRALAKSALGAVVALCLCLPGTTALAQVDTGTILGTVKDTSGAVLPGAKVTVTHEGEALTLSAVTRADGTYIFTPIKIGSYSVAVEYAGFRKALRRGITLNIQGQAVVDFALAPGDMVEAVEVTADAPLLETQTGTVGQVVTGDTIKNLPLNGRDYTFLARLSAGVVPPHQGARAPLQFSANGIKPSQNNYLLDGIDNNNSNVDFLSGVAYVIKPPVDAIGEFKILTSSFSAEYGRAGGAVLNATLKSGSNEFHGSAWEFHRNDGLNANNFFANRAGVKKGEYRSNQFGFTAGGPLVKGKTFWFADYEGTLIKQARVWNETVPTARERASGFTDFSDLIALQSGTIGPDILGRSFPRGTVFDPATTRPLQAGQVDPVTGGVAVSTGYAREPFPGNIVPAGRIDPNALKLMMLYPEATLAGLNNNYVVNRTNTDDTHAFDLRVDHNFSENDRVFARYSFSDNNKLRPPPFEGDADGGGFSEGTETVRVHGLALSHTHVFSSTLINEARFGFGRERTYRLQPNGDDTSDIPAKYGILGVPQLAGNGGLPRIEPSGLRRLGHDGWVVSERFSNTLQFSDNLTKVYKSHTFKGGYTYQHIFFGSTQPPFARGEFFFNGNYTSMVNRREDYAGRVQFLLSPIAATVPGGVDFLGGMSQLNVSPFGSVDALKWYQGAYAQDSWRATSKLTLNYGLRWDYFSREQEREWEQANMDPGPPARYLIPARWKSKQLSPSFLANLQKDGIELVYTDEFGSGLGKMPKMNFAPRFDFAYQFTPRLVARGGYGLFYGAFENRGGNPSLGYNYPFQFDLRYFPPNDTTPNRVADGSIAYLRARQGINLDPLLVNANGLGLRGVEFDYKTPRYHSFNVNVQMELGGNHALEVGYVGTRGRHLEINTGMNNVDRLLPPGTNANLYIPFPDFARGGVFYARTLGKSSYDSLQVKLQRRMHKGLSFLATYTLGNPRTNSGDFLGGENIGGLRAQGIAAWSLDNDIRRGGQYVKHALVFSGTYELPGKGPILGGWHANWLFMAYSGQAQTINCSRTTGATTGCYALLVGDPYAGSHNVEQFYNPAAFANPANVATIGQTDFSPLGGPGTQVTGPPWRQLDVGLAKQFTVSGRQLEFRAEAFNLTNTPAFNLPGSLNFEDARNFAQITGQRNNPRIVQLGLKFYW
jgi:hypothetical protein